MDVVIFNLIGDIPLVTKTWVLGSFALSVLISTKLIDSTKLLYNYDLVFQRGQYQRIFYSIFNYGELNLVSIVNIFISANHLSLLENSINNKRKFIWMIFLMLNIILVMTAYVQPVSSLGVVLHENLVYFQLKKNSQQMNFVLIGGINISPTIIPIYMYSVMYFVYQRSLLEISMNFLAGHTIYYLDDVMSKIYDIDFCKTPYDIWLDYTKTNSDTEEEVFVGQEAEIHMEMDQEELEIHEATDEDDI
ncbi:hypothetical protein KAFR_0E03150 [Kazachstania africana CBS 2517]|uniref:Derlin n=1 Tax=Kazachstania africana (strain ATCC 22294 / BCRC 22015 / CBS 2517 / CECT 1963 / NBRC 1671 / NRRL Y-8276) TaxID=1071382 RepID=H2AVR7_KAZAF|nr:hypothetical protein KAFR_0E03150 [Kazachstania africana CBS 2517]CCF58467.1 hypothetical protein KAFR_0E03150 [Kazachstania africana CBS 2517]